MGMMEWIIPAKAKEEFTPKRTPNKQRAIINGKIATIHEGKRIVETYKSGQKLKGKIEN